MNLILWRHAEAEELPDPLSLSRHADLQRPLTRRGRKQADASAAWLRAQLPAHTRVLCSPALRTRETAAAFTGKSEIVDDLAPGADVSTVLDAIGWPQGDETLWWSATTLDWTAGQPAAGRHGNGLERAQERDLVAGEPYPRKRSTDRAACGHQSRVPLTRTTKEILKSRPNPVWVRQRPRTAGKIGKVR